MIDLSKDQLQNTITTVLNKEDITLQDEFIYVNSLPVEPKP